MALFYAILYLNTRNEKKGKPKMSEEKISANENIGTRQKIELHLAITELMLDLKGEGTVEALAEKIGVPRKRLANNFKEYQKHLKGEDVSQSTDLRWELDPLIGVADKLKIHVSDIIHAAEDVLEGLPPWFHVRISSNASPRTREELVNVFLEAAGCRTYAMEDPLGVRRERRSFKHGKRTLFSQDAVPSLKTFVDVVLGNSHLQEFRDAYEDGTITSVDAYRALKGIIDSVIGNIEDIGTKTGVLDFVNLLLNNREDLTTKIVSEVHCLLKQKDPKPRSGKEKAKKR